MKARLIVVMGKGGVGKTVISAAMGYALARRGLRTLIIEVGDEDVVNGFFNDHTGSYQAREVMSGLWTMLIDPWKALSEYGMMKLHFKPFYNLVFGNSMINRLMQAVPGLAELLILGKVGFEVERQVKNRPKWDCVILDLPAMGHGQGILSIPNAVIATMKTGPMTMEAKALRNMLTDKRRSSIVMVTLCEMMPVQETLQYSEVIKSSIDRRPDLMIANRMLPIEMNKYEQKTAAAMHRAARRKGLKDMEEVLDKAMILARMQDDRKQALQFLESRIDLPVHGVPMVPVEGLPRIQRIAGQVEDWAMKLME